MAEALVFKLVVNISSVLGSEAVNQAKSLIAPLIEVKDKIRELEGEFAVMQGFISDAEKTRHKSKATEKWLEQVIKMSYQAEDILDEYTYLIQMRQTRDGFWGSCIYKAIHDVANLNAWLNISSQLGRVHKTLKQNLPDMKNLYGIDVGAGSSQQSDHEGQSFQYLAEKAHFIEEEEIVGVDEYTDILMAYLKDDDKERLQWSMISVWGMGGVGKTTLVARVCKKVKHVFDCYAWITISSMSYDVDDLLKKILMRLCMEKKEDVPYNNRSSVEDVPYDKISTMDYMNLVATLRNYLKDRRYLIVLDDVWERNDWDKIKEAFIDSKNGSRIVITTRQYDVALLAAKILEIKPLEEDAAWSLFCKKAFYKDPDKRCPEQLEHWARKITDKCGSLPLAIATTGSFLALKETTEVKWKEVHDNLTLEITENKEFEQTMSILNLSFIDLPPYLVNCFLYCGLFPEDCFMERRTLVRLWMAEGFVKEWGTKTMEEVAEDYLNQLVHRSMIQVAEWEPTEAVFSYKVHDLIRDLIISKYKKGKLCMLIHGDTISEGMLKAGERCRRLSFHKSKRNLNMNIENFQHLRSFLAFDKVPAKAFRFSSFKLLRVLDLQNSQIKMVPHQVFNLFNLRYLSLRGCDEIKKLSNSLGMLKNLQTLDVRGTGLVKLPNSLVRLKDLRHLLTVEFIPFPHGLSKLTALQTLEKVLANEEIIEEVGCLEEMRSLMLSWTGLDCAKLCASLKKMKHLRRLTLIIPHEEEVRPLDDLFPPPPFLQSLWLRAKLANGMLPKCFDKFHLKNLTNLRLLRSKLGQDSFPFLGELPNLMVLVLSDEAFIGETICFRDGLFSKLKHLWFFKLNNLNRVEIEKGALVSLELLSLEDCPNLKMMPLGIENLKSLYINGMAEELTSQLRLRKSGSEQDQEADLHTLKHIPYISIDGSFLET